MTFTILQDSNDDISHRGSFTHGLYRRLMSTGTHYISGTGCVPLLRLQIGVTSSKVDPIENLLLDSGTDLENSFPSRTKVSPF